MFIFYGQKLSAHQTKTIQSSSLFNIARTVTSFNLFSETIQYTNIKVLRNVLEFNAALKKNIFLKHPHYSMICYIDCSMLITSVILSEFF